MSRRGHLQETQKDNKSRGLSQVGEGVDEKVLGGTSDILEDREGRGR